MSDNGTNYVVSPGQVVTVDTYISATADLAGGGTQIVPLPPLVSSGGVLIVAGGGVVAGALIAGAETVEAGGIDVQATGGPLVVAQGGVAINSIVNAGTVAAGGTEEVLSTFSEDGLNLLGFPIESGLTFLAGAQLAVVSGGTIAGNRFLSGFTFALAPGIVESATTIEAGAALVVQGGGTVQHDFVLTGGTETLLAHASALNVALAGGRLAVSAGGAALSTTVSSGGIEAISAGGTAIVGGVFTGGTIDILAHGTAIDPDNIGGEIRLDSGGTLLVSAGQLIGPFTLMAGGIVDARPTASTSGAIVTSGATLALPATAKDIYTTVKFGGSDIVRSGVIALNDTVLAGGGMSVQAGGSAIEDQLGSVTYVASGTGYVQATASGGALTVSSGGRVTATAVHSGGQETVQAHASDSTDNVYAGGTLTVSSGGVAIDTQNHGGTAVIEASGSEVVNASGIGSGVTLEGGAILQVAPGRNIVAMTLENGFTLDVGTGLGDYDTFVGSQGVEQVVSGGVAHDTVVQGGGSALVQAFGTISSATLTGNATLELAAGAIATGGIAFSGGGSLLKLDGTDTPGAAIGSFLGNTIDLAGLAFVSASSFSISSGNTLRVTQGGSSDVLTLAPGAHLASAVFDVTGDGSGGTAIVETIACFLAGTRIATPAGEVPVETLRPGDAVLAGEGDHWETRTLRWVGRRRLDCGRHARPASVQPVRVRAHAFAPNRPHRDLLLSPDHAVFMDGALVPVGSLLNGLTIVQEFCADVTYWHVELDRHAVILAEGLPCESFFDTGNCAAFENGGTALALHPDFAQRMWDGAACAPLLRTGPALAARQAALVARALALGWAGHSETA